MKQIAGKWIVHFLIITVLILMLAFSGFKIFHKTDIDFSYQKQIDYNSEETQKIGSSSGYAINLSSGTIQKGTDMTRIDDLFDIKQVFCGGIKDNFVVDEYKNILILWSDDIGLSGSHYKEALIAMDNSTGKLLWSIESSKGARTISYCIDYNIGYCYVNYDNYVKCIEILSGKQIWIYEYDTFDNGIAYMENNIFLYSSKQGILIMLDTVTGKKNKQISVDKHYHMFSGSKKQNTCILYENNNIKLLDETGRVIKNIGGELIYFNGEDFISLDYFTNKNMRIYKYISLNNPSKEITVNTDKEGSLYFVSEKHLLLYRKGIIKLFSIDRNAFMWEKEMDGFKSSLIDNDDILLFGGKIIRAQLDSGKEKWCSDSPFKVSYNEYKFVINDKLFVANRMQYEVENGVYRIYDMNDGKYLYQVSDLFAFFPFNKIDVSPIFVGDKEFYISQGERIYSIAKDPKLNVKYYYNKLYK